VISSAVRATARHWRDCRNAFRSHVDDQDIEQFGKRLGLSEIKKAQTRGRGKTPTLRNVAERAGVSHAAVSRTFTEGGSVSAEMRRKVEKAARELGYFPNALASSLTTGRTKLIGLIADNFDNPFFLRVFDLLTLALQEKGLRPLLLNLRNETGAANAIRLLQQYSVEGVLLTASNRPVGFATSIRDAGMPVVHTFGPIRSAPSVHVVGIDNVEGGRIAARTLVERGYKRIGFIGGTEATATTRDRMSGFLSEAARHADVTTTHSFASNYSFDAGYREMHRLLSGERAEAYFCADDILSIGAVSAVQDAGLSVPGDVGIIGLNDMEMAGWRNIRLTTIRQPVQEIVTSSIELLTAILEDTDRYPETRTFACELIERDTLRPLKR
jgi:DNA-binding LacI/PurR family transcriptional regulator